MWPDNRGNNEGQKIMVFFFTFLKTEVVKLRCIRTLTKLVKTRPHEFDNKVNIELCMFSNISTKFSTYYFHYSFCVLKFVSNSRNTEMNLASLFLQVEIEKN